MKTPLLFLFCICSFYLQAQVTTPVVNAGFGVDAELRANVVARDMQTSDDWFSDGTGNGFPGAGTFIIDTTGAAAMTTRFAIDPAFRKLPFYRTMRFPAYYVHNNKMLIDGVFIRDYHGDDSTVFASGGNKNGQSPANWQTPIAQSVPDKNDIEDMFVHIRRDGPSSSSPLWLSAGVSLISSNGNRYFDFEMYQTDIFYSRTSQKFYNYGPNGGHTAWTLDAAGNIIKPGDVIFTAQYGNASLDSVEARIWVHKSALNIVPASFKWGGAFDGGSSGAEYGYANIKPKTAGDFYTGIQNKTASWAGPFKFVDGGNNVVTDYLGGQFMEFSVNLSKLGLDPVTMLGGSACGLPFRRVLAKSRTSTSFSSELKDFVGPFDFFLSPKVDAQAEAPVLCSANGVSKINILNPYSTSIYTWSTPDGSIADSTNKTSIYINRPGTYIVKQQLMNGCGAYASDTVKIVYDLACTVLDAPGIRLSGELREGKPSLRWVSAINDKSYSYEIQRSVDGRPFEVAGLIENEKHVTALASYSFWDEKVTDHASEVSYRIKATTNLGDYLSSTFLIKYPYTIKLSLFPNPASKDVNLTIFSENKQQVEINIINLAGKSVYKRLANVKQGRNSLLIEGIQNWTPGMYMVKIMNGTTLVSQKLIIAGRA